LNSSNSSDNDFFAFMMMLKAWHIVAVAV